ncbi:MAG: hypothetical protein K6F14_01565 [Clostridiales bacterium]|nr:hypothetical protein [Clostridiales bacterium]
MSEVKSTLKRIGIYYLLWIVTLILSMGVIVNNFPTRNITTFYLLVLSVYLVLYYLHRVSPSGRLSVMMKLLAWMGLLLILFRGMKYGPFSAVDILARHTWYLYYVPVLLLSLFLFGIALFISPKNNGLVSVFWYTALVVTVVLIVLILTNDLHQQAFVFQENFANWDSDYKYGWLFYVANVWLYLLFFAAIVVLVVKCRISSSKKSAWIILIPVVIRIVLFIFMVNGIQITEFPETHIFTAAIILECCMQLGLIPTNTDYGKLFKNLPISSQITDKKGTIVYSSPASAPISSEQFNMESGTRIGEHTILHKMPIPGGYGFWQDDLTELDRLNDELAEAKEGLEQEADLIRLRNELIEKQTKISQRTQMYDTIARCTQKQSQAISQYAKQAQNSDDPAEKDFCRRRIILLGAYIKRYANLMLLSQESDVIETGELGLSVSELLKYLNYNSVPGEFVGHPMGSIPSSSVLVMFEAFESLIENNLSQLHGVFVNLSGDNPTVFKVVFENISEPIPDELMDKLSSEGIKVEETREDNILYISFSIGEGGDAS